MLKIEENKTRKRLRIAQCILYACLTFFCSFPFIQGADSTGKYNSYSVLDLISMIGTNEDASDLSLAFQRYVIFAPLLIVIPVVAFFFCVLDRQSNLKNVVSIISCALGVLLTVFMTGSLISLGAIFSLLFYILASFLSTLAIFARFTDDSKVVLKNEK